MSQLLTLLEKAGVEFPPGLSNVEVRGISEDSREIEPGDVFVAIPGTRESGARYAMSAVARGAVAVISEEALAIDATGVVVPDARLALADLSAALYDFPARELVCFGVTGTDGKSTTCFLLASILRAAGLPTGLMTTVQTEAGGQPVFRENRLTTPSPPFVQHTLRAMVEAGDQYAVVECSSHALVQERLRNVEFHSAAITNVASDHVEFHGSQAEYERAKSLIGSLVESGREAGRLVVNADDAGAVRVARQATRDLLLYGTGPGAELRASHIESDLFSATFTVEWNARSIDMLMPLGGPYNVHNALAAIGLALSVPLDLEPMAAGLAHPVLPAGRLQRVDEGQGFSLFVDYAHTEQAFATVIRFLSSAAVNSGGRLIAVFGAAGDRDRGKRPRLAQIAAQFCSLFVITNEDPFGEDPAAIVREIACGAPPETEGRQWIVELDRRRAIELALARAETGDVVVILGKGHERSIVDGATSTPWSDVEISRELLRDSAVPS